MHPPTPPPCLPRSSPATVHHPPTHSPTHPLTHTHAHPLTCPPQKRFLYFPNLAKAVGSDPLAARVAALRPALHLFGHTHFSWDATPLGDGVRYVQWPLGYPAEQRSRRNGGAGWRPLVVWDGEAGGFQPPRECYWSEYYATQERTPSNVAPAPWVTG